MTDTTDAAVYPSDCFRTITTSGAPNADSQRWVHWADFQSVKAERDALRAQIAEAEARGVQVKPLVWTPRGDGAQWYAKCQNDRFHYTALPQFREEPDGQWMTYLDDIWRPYPTLEDAKAAAQADYEARIRSYLTDAPSDEYTRGRIAGLKEAAVIADQWATDTQRIYGNGGPAAAIRALIGDAT